MSDRLDYTDVEVLELALQEVKKGEGTGLPAHLSETLRRVRVAAATTDPDLDRWFDHPTAKQAFVAMQMRLLGDTCVGNPVLHEGYVREMLEAVEAGEGTDRGSSVIAFLVAAT